VDRLARVVVLGSCLGGVAACGAGTAAEPASTAAGMTSTTPTTVVVTSTSSAPTTTLSPQQRDEAEIREIHDRFFKMMELAGNPPNPNRPEIEATTTGIQLQRSTEAIQQMVEQHQHSEGDLRGKVISIRFADVDHASVRDCVTSTSVLFDADGAIVVDHPEGPRITSVELLRTPEGWRVNDWLTGGDHSCEA
jgi:hypothetical protein